MSGLSFVHMYALFPQKDELTFWSHVLLWKVDISQMWDNSFQCLTEQKHGYKHWSVYMRHYKDISSEFNDCHGLLSSYQR